MIAAFLPLVLLASPTPFQVEWPHEVEDALMFAGPNRVEIERALNHFVQEGDAQKVDAIQFLVANMPGHGYTTYGLFDEAGNEVAFDALEHQGLGAAQKAMDALEAEHGPLEFQKRALREDLHTLDGDTLIENVDRAFEAWRTNPWSADMSYETFREHVLPYRGSNEPIEDWRGPLMADVRERVAELAEADAKSVAGLAMKIANQKIGFSDLYYLHPTDQGFAEMSEKRRGRCEDITNMQTYAMRAACVASAADYTPWWGHRDNNHAWSVVLDGEGKGRSGAGNRAAKVYRKTYSKQRDNLVFQLKPGEQAPRWLDRETYRDVTDQYFDTHEVVVPLPYNLTNRFAYLCVFNGGEWRPIHWAKIENGKATFDKMNGGLLYKPAYYVDGRVQYAAAPFFLTADGEVQHIGVDAEATDTVLLPTKDGVPYELFEWLGGWKPIGTVEGVEGGVERELTKGALLWMTAPNGRKLERPFRYVDGKRQAF